LNFFFTPTSLFSSIVHKKFIKIISYTIFFHRCQYHEITEKKIKISTFFSSQGLNSPSIRFKPTLQTISTHNNIHAFDVFK